MLWKLPGQSTNQKLTYPAYFQWVWFKTRTRYATASLRAFGSFAVAGGDCGGACSSL
jgi:hypothetical protein